MITVTDAHQKFINHLTKKGRSSATILAYGKDIEQLLVFLRGLNRAHVHEITTPDIETFMAKLAKEGYTSKTISRKTNSTKTFFRFLKVEEYITDDPAVVIAHPRFEVKPPRVLTSQEYRALRDACRGDLRTSAVVELLLQTGIRIGELALLQVDDVQLTNGQPFILIKAIPGHAQRSIPLNKAAAQAIRNYLAVRPKSRSKILFITKTGKPLLVRNVRTSIDRYFRLAGVQNAKVNDLRHTWVAHHLQKGTSLTLIAKLAGHKRVSTTERYLQFLGDRGEKIAKLEEL